MTRALLVVVGALIVALASPATAMAGYRTVAAYGSSLVLAGGDNGTLARSVDGGVRWAVQNAGLGQPITRIRFVDSQCVFLLTGNGTVRRSLDGGRTWSTRGSLGGSGLPGSSGLKMADRSEGWAAGGVGIGDGYGALKIYKTTDAGATWVEQPKGPYLSGGSDDQWGISDLDYAGGGNGFVVGTNFTSFLTTNGASWSNDQGIVGRAVDLIGSVGYVVGYGAPAVSKRSAPSGPWSAMSVPVPNAAMNAVHFITPTVGWVAGDAGRIWKTTNGSTWVAQRSGTAESFGGIVFTDASRGWAVTNGAVLRSTNGGASWTRSAIPALPAPLVNPTLDANPVTPNNDGWTDYGRLNITYGGGNDRFDVVLYDAAWRRVRTVVDGFPLGPSARQFWFRIDAKDGAGRTLPDGVYHLIATVHSPAGRTSPPPFTMFVNSRMRAGTVPLPFGADIGERGVSAQTIVPYPGGADPTSTTLSTFAGASNMSEGPPWPQYAYVGIFGQPRGTAGGRVRDIVGAQNTTISANATETWTWDGKDNGGEFVAPGTYWFWAATNNGPQINTHPAYTDVTWLPVTVGPVPGATKPVITRVSAAPNPFYPAGGSTTATVTVDKPSWVKVSVRAWWGEVTTLDARYMEAGTSEEFDWNGRGYQANGGWGVCAPGNYQLRVEASNAAGTSTVNGVLMVR